MNPDALLPLRPVELIYFPIPPYMLRTEKTFRLLQNIKSFWWDLLNADTACKSRTEAEPEQQPERRVFPMHLGGEPKLKYEQQPSQYGRSSVAAPLRLNVQWRGKGGRGGPSVLD